MQRTLVALWSANMPSSPRMIEDVLSQNDRGRLQDDAVAAGDRTFVCANALLRLCARMHYVHVGKRWSSYRYAV